jgi:arylsulfatase A-like enzyme
MPSLWTGLLPSHHGTLRRNDTLSPDLVTAAELFAASGHQTVAHVANPVLTARFGLDQGWDVYAETDVVLRDGEDWRRHESAAKLQSSFLSWLDHERDAKRPFLAWIHYWDVHGPYLPPPGYLDMFPPERRRALTADEIGRVQKGLRLPVDDLAYYVSSYDAEIRYVDDRIAELLAALAARGLDRSTYVVLTADHGEAFLEHGSWDHGETLHEEQIHVPLILAGPGLAPRTVERVVSSVDLFPTLLDLAAIPAPPSDGTSLRPLLSGDDDAAYTRTVAVSEVSHRRDGMHRAARDAERKLLAHDLAATELFDLSRDPGETTDRLADEPAAAAALRAALVEQLAARPIAPQAREATVEPELDRRLRALGYAE